MSEDDLLYLKGKGVRALVRMAETDRARVTATQIEEVGFTDCHQPVADFTAPTQDQISQMIAFVEESLARGRPVGISCGAGIGRTGTILACYLVSKSRTADDAIREVELRRGAKIETDSQIEVVREYAKRLGECR